MPDLFSPYLAVMYFALLITPLPFPANMTRVSGKHTKIKRGEGIPSMKWPYVQGMVLFYHLSPMGNFESGVTCFVYVGSVFLE